MRRTKGQIQKEKALRDVLRVKAKEISFCLTDNRLFAVFNKGVFFVYKLGDFHEYPDNFPIEHIGATEVGSDIFIVEQIII